MTGKIYCGKETSFSAGGVIFKPGEALTRKALSSISSKNMKRHLADGTLAMEGGAPEKPVEEQPPRDPVKTWNLNPLALVGKTLQHLNIMVLERDPTMTPFETLEEAAAQLTRDFKGN